MISVSNILRTEDAIPVLAMLVRAMVEKAAELQTISHEPNPFRMMRSFMFRIDVSERWLIDIFREERVLQPNPYDKRRPRINSRFRTRVVR